MGIIREAVLICLSATLSAVLAADPTFPIAKDGCRDTCGNVNVPYPFGMTEECSYDGQFLITCDETYDPALAFWRNSPPINVTNITLDGKLHVWQDIAKGCYNELRNLSVSYNSSPEFVVSETDNIFVGVGCYTLAYIGDLQGESYQGCMTGCNGIGFCQTSIPQDLIQYQIFLESLINDSFVWESNPCSYAFIVEGQTFNFSEAYLHELNNTKKLPMVLNWTIENTTCGQVKESICQANSYCVDVGNSGYRCECNAGYQGNPYLPAGCQDIKECSDPKLSNCTYKCSELPGTYTCSCREGYHGDGRSDREGCTIDTSRLILLTAVPCVVLVVVVICATSVYWGYKRRKLIKLKEKLFRQNGGLLLQQQLMTREGSSAKTARIFSAEELKKATNDYDESKVIGKGGYGTVYKGVLADGLAVAIKKPKVVDHSQIEQFINEVVVVSQINHRNVVKLLGCCLEDEVPLLVYEYITNGTLSDHIHDESKALMMNWETRLRIAAETAGVLSYLHSAASIPIIHRDVKSSNILLDDSFTAKVADFGASRLIPLDQAGLSTRVQGTLGYLDPEYLQTSQLTEKSDVYSFGVVLVELLTGQKAVSYRRPKEHQSTLNLAMYFLSTLNQDGLVGIVEKCVEEECKAEHLKEFADLAKRCLRMEGDERPTMKEVAMELEGLLRETMRHPWTGKGTYPEETEHLLGEPIELVEYKPHGSATSGYDSMKDQLSLNIEVGSGR